MFGRVGGRHDQRAGEGSLGSGEGERRLGGLRGASPTTFMRERSAEALRKRSQERAADLSPAIASALAAGATSLRAIAAGARCTRHPNAIRARPLEGSAGVTGPAAQYQTLTPRTGETKVASSSQTPGQHSPGRSAARALSAPYFTPTLEDRACGWAALRLNCWLLLLHYFNGDGARYRRRSFAPVAAQWPDEAANSARDYTATQDPIGGG